MVGPVARALPVGIADTSSQLQHRCHLILSQLRPAGGKGIGLPRNFLFNFISCPNYTAEILGWVSGAIHLSEEC